MNTEPDQHGLSGEARQVEAGRQAVMALCAEARSAELAEIVGRAADCASARDLRPAETGLVLLRGRMGGDGAPFNVGEATVTRAAIELNGRTGFAYQLGRDRRKARDAAILDALWQDAEQRAGIEAALAPVRERLAAEREQERRRTAATRVNFFTLARGED